MKITGQLFLGLLLIIVSYDARAELGLYGMKRNDMILSQNENSRAEFSDVLESRIVLSSNNENWRFYQDLRIYVYQGAIAEDIAQQAIDGFSEKLHLILSVEPEDYIEIFGSEGTLLHIRLMRAFIRYYSPIGDITFGKTYVHFGSPGLFNIFEIDKTVNFSDLLYDKGGILATEYSLSLGTLSGLYAYVSPQTDLTNTAAGAGVYTSLAGFDAGFVWQHKQSSRNQLGVHFKGDLGVGIDGSIAYHVEEEAGELHLGIDYSFFSQRLVTAAGWYYCRSGASTPEEYDHETERDAYFLADSYFYGSISWVHNEFFMAAFQFFVNTVDGSSVLLPSVKYTASDGLDFSLQGAILTGSAEDEFSDDVYGRFNIVFRCEVKM